MKHSLLPIVLALPLIVSACKSEEQTCEGPGDCPAGAICSGGICEAVMTPLLQTPALDRTPARAFMMQVRSWIRVPLAPIDANIVFRDMGFDLDAAPSVPQDVGGGVDPADAGEPVFDVPVVNVLTLGDACEVPNLEQGETDPCSIDNPNYYCIANLSGQGGYCTQACEVSDHEEEGDAGNVDNTRGAGCCVAVPNDEDAGQLPGDLIEGVSLRAGLQLEANHTLWVLAVLLSSCERTAPCDGPGTSRRWLGLPARPASALPSVTPARSLSIQVRAYWMRRGTPASHPP